MAFLKYKSVSIIIALFLFSAFSQEISLDLESITQKTHEKNKEKSLEKPSWAASGLNLLIPGTGYFYLGQTKPATAFLTTDLTLWGGFLFTHFTARKRYESSIGFARLYAGTHSTRHYDDPYWGYLGNKNFMRTQDFNWAILNNRELNGTYTDENDQWNWDSEEHRDEYSKNRKEATHWKTASTLVLGSLALNRLISFISGRVATKRYNDKLNVLVQPIISTDINLQNRQYGLNFSIGI